MTRLAAGCMTGTSIDSIDAALVEITGCGLDMTTRFLRGASAPLGDLAPRLRRLAEQEPMTAGDIARLSRDFSLAHIPVLREMLGEDRPDLICIHGQTVFHQPPASWQMLTPAVITHELKAPIVFDLRAADLAAGGQGAPITPIADWVFFRQQPVPGNARIAVINLGGFCNITHLKGTPTDPFRAEFFAYAVEEMGYPELAAPLKDRSPRHITGCDVCPCNQLLDTIARRLFSEPYDANGAHAAGGQVHTDAFEDLQAVLKNLHDQKRSLGTGDETGEWITRWKPHARAEDLAATASEAIAAAIGPATQGAALVLLAGGGVKNRALVEDIRAYCTGAVQAVDELGLPAEYREAAAFAVLGALCEDRVPITMRHITGVSIPVPVSGAWVYP